MARAHYRRWFSYALNYWPYLLVALGTVVAVISVDAFLPQVVSWVIDSVLTTSSPLVTLPWIGGVDRTVFFLGLFGALVFLVSIRSVFQYHRTVLLALVGEKIHLDLRNALFDRLHRLPISYFDKSYTGKIMARITTDTDALWGLLFNGVNGIVAPLISFCIVIVLVASADPWLTLVIFLVVPVFFTVYSRARKKVIRAARLQRDVLSRIYSRLQEQIAGIRIVRIFGRASGEKAIFSAILTKLYHRNLTLMKCNGGLGAKGDFIVGFGTAMILCAGGLAVAAGRITIGQLVQFYAYAGMLFLPIQTIANTMAQTLSNAEVAMERIFELMDQEPAAELEGGEPCPPVEGRIELRNLSFAYHSGIPALTNVSLKIEPGTMTALVGPSGAGKTTLVHLICRFYQAQTGELRVDGRDLSGLEVESFRSQISYVSQDNFLFSGSVAENIGYAKAGATRAEIEDAARLANAHEFILALPQGYETILGERGVNLSGGQRQRINIARALVRHPRILIMDEPTSALDAESEAVIFQALTNVFRGLTCLVIAHRLSTVMNADSILVFDQSRLVQSGTHQGLVDQPGIYRDLCLRQLIGPGGVTPGNPTTV